MNRRLDIKYTEMEHNKIPLKTKWRNRMGLP